MDYDELPGPEDLPIRVPRDDAYRTCAVCGRDCPPEAMPTDAGMHVAFSCPEHGLHSVVDPFEGLR